MDFDQIKVSIADKVATVVLFDPATLNSIGVDMIEELSAAFQALAADPQVRAVVLTGHGRSFSSGVNLTRRRPAEAGAPTGSVLETHFNPFVTLMRDFAKPIVTAINGPAAGVGCSIALMGDLIVAGESAYFLQAFRRIGLVPDGGSTYILPRLIGRARTMEMTLLGERLPAAKALEWGLINRCVPDDELAATAEGLARQLADGPMSLSLIRKLVWQSLDAEWAEQLHAEASTQSIAGKSNDATEGRAAFREKRPAQFTGS